MPLKTNFSSPHFFLALCNVHDCHEEIAVTLAGFAWIDRRFCLFSGYPQQPIGPYGQVQGVAPNLSQQNNMPQQANGGKEQVSPKSYPKYWLFVVDISTHCFK